MKSFNYLDNQEFKHADEVSDDAREKLRGLEEKADSLSERLAEKKAEHEKKEIDSYINRASAKDVSVLSSQIQTLINDSKRNKAEQLLAGEELERAEKALHESKKRAITLAKIEQLEKQIEVAKKIQESVTGVWGAIKEVWNLNHDLNSIAEREARIDLRLWVFIPRELKDMDTPEFQRVFLKGVNEEIQFLEKQKNDLELQLTNLQKAS